MRTLFLLVCLCCCQTLHARSESQLSFAEQLRLSNVRYIRGKIKGHLSSLDDTNSFVAATTQESLSKRIDKGAKREKGLVKAVEAVISLQKKHNDRVAKWQKQSNTRKPELYYSLLEMSPENVRRARRESFGDPWAYVSVHWAPHALDKGMLEHPIAFQGLELTPSNWLDGDDEVKQYAFFAFLRQLSTLKKESRQRAFLQVQVGAHLSPTVWEAEREEFHFSRYKKSDYYVYEGVIEPPVVDSLPLVELIISRSCPPKAATVADLPDFYKRKLRLFKNAAAELHRCLKSKKRNDLHFAVYSFVASSFPFVSPFNHTLKNKETWNFASGYPGDHPGLNTFDKKTPMGMAWAIFKASAGLPKQAQRSIGPLFLLPMSYDNSSPQDLLAADRRVGFVGFYHFYQRLRLKDRAGD